ncbi:MAG: hypothetical protein US77_C0008G0001, partial [Microgenomates group bacterium GW2011_GWC1_38_14]
VSARYASRNRETLPLAPGRLFYTLGVFAYTNFVDIEKLARDSSVRLRSLWSGHHLVCFVC